MGTELAVHTNNKIAGLYEVAPRVLLMREDFRIMRSEISNANEAPALSSVVEVLTIIV